MDAIVSGSAGIAVMFDGECVWSLTPTVDGGTKTRRSIHEVPRLFGEARDLTFLEGVDEESIAEELEAAHTGVVALHLALMVCDPVTSPHTHELATDDLESLLANSSSVERAERILAARPMPHPFSPSVALERARGRGRHNVAAFFRALASRQDLIRTVRRAWDLMPSHLFDGDDDREMAEGVVAREGLFRDMVLVFEAKTSSETWLRQALANFAIARLPKCNAFLREWVDSLTTRKEDDFMVRLPSAIIDAVDAGCDRQARRFASELVAHQVAAGGARAAATSLWALVERVGRHGRTRLSRELADWTARVGPDDVQPWINERNATLPIDQTPAALQPDWTTPAPLLVQLFRLVATTLVESTVDERERHNDLYETATKPSSARIQPTRRHGLRVASADGRPTYLVPDTQEVHPRAFPETDEDNDLDGDSQALLQLVIPTCDWLDAKERPRVRSDASMAPSEGEVRAARVVRIPMAPWLAGGGGATHADLVRFWAMNPAPAHRAIVENLP